MKIIYETILFTKYPKDDGLKEKVRLILENICNDIKDSIRVMYHPEENNEKKYFKINPKNRGTNEHPNGVNPIKDQFTLTVIEKGWKTEKPFNLNKNYQSKTGGPGPLDYVKKIEEEIFDKSLIFTVEWETGNVSSSHRAINKMIMGILFGNIFGGLIIVPTRKFAKYLTDRVGNYEELEPYFPLWKEMKNNENLKFGFLGILGIEYDELDDTVPYIPKGQDGRAIKIRPNLKELKNLAKFKGIMKISTKNSSGLIEEIESLEDKPIELIWREYKRIKEQSRSITDF